MLCKDLASSGHVSLTPDRDHGKGPGVADLGQVAGGGLLLWRGSPGITLTPVSHAAASQHQGSGGCGLLLSQCNLRGPIFGGITALLKMHAKVLTKDGPRVAVARSPA